MSIDKIKVGVYICHCGKNIADVVDVESLTEYAKTQPNVEISINYKFMCSKNGQQIISNDIESGRINRVVVAACSPLMHEPTFRRVLDRNNLNQFFFEQANIREHCSWVNMADKVGALRIAKDHLKMAIAKVSKDRSMFLQKFPVNQEIMVIGGGISGMFSALDVADKYKVYLVERSPTIGGHMGQLDKTFPTMDCSACIITPKMTDVGRHPNIKLLTYSEVEKMEAGVGKFTVSVRQKARKIDHNICTGCGACASICPVTAPNEFDINMAHRGAAYLPFPQAVPGQYTIDKNACIECGLCVTACEVGAINLGQQDEIMDIDVGAIIITTGNEIFDPSDIVRYGYLKYKNVITGIEMERLLSSSGPTLGKVIKPSDHHTPKRVAFLQCVGSRNFQDGAHKYCSRVCCMYAMKHARQFKEKYPESEVYIFYIDIRAFGKGYEEFYEIAGRQYGINFIRGRVGEIYENYDHSLLIRGTDTLLDERYEVNVDLVVLSTAIEAQKDAVDLGRYFGVQTTEDGFFMEAHPKLRPVDSLMDGIFMAGTCQAPKDIPDSVAQAKAAAASAINYVQMGEVSIEPYNSFVREALCAGCRSCVQLCPYSAITFNELTNKAEISRTKCKGCGVCMATCPSGAIDQNHFTRAQILAELGVLHPWEGVKK
jgi:heterodisulfide reductase subunit A